MDILEGQIRNFYNILLVEFKKINPGESYTFEPAEFHKKTEFRVTICGEIDAVKVWMILDKSLSWLAKYGQSVRDKTFIKFELEPVYNIHNDASLILHAIQRKMER